MMTLLIFGQEKHHTTIALTLDDGPSGALTEEFLNLFEQYGIQVTFFHIGHKSAQQKELCREILKKGHEIGNHSWSHQRLTELDSTAVRLEIEDFQRFFIDSLDYRPVSFRAPFLKRNAIVDSICTENQLHIVAADVYASDAKPGLEPEEIVENLDVDIPDGSVILCHERKHTLDALKILLPVWKEKHYRFVNVKALIN